MTKSSIKKRLKEILEKAFGSMWESKAVGDVVNDISKEIDKAVDNTLDEAIAIFEKMPDDEPFTKNPIILELKVLKDKLKPKQDL